MALLTDQIAFTGTPASGDLIHLVDVSDTSQNPAGSSYKATLSDLSSFFSSSDGYWTSGSTGTNSIKAINPSGLDATGTYAVAIGLATIASGYASLAMGNNTSATTIGSFATGRQTVAGGNYALAQGYFSEATGAYAVSTGGFTVASGDTSFAMGNRSVAGAQHSFAGGNRSSATTQTAFAFGDGVLASGQESFAGGTTSLASGTTSFTHGFESRSTGNYAHSLGYRSRATGVASFAINGDPNKGNYSEAIGYASFAGGSDSTASGDTSFAFGVGCETNDDFALAMGNGSVANGVRSVALMSSRADGYAAMSIGDGNVAYSDNSFVGGSKNSTGAVYVSGDTSFVFMNTTDSTSKGVVSDYSAILGGQDNHLNSGATRSVILGGTGITGSTADMVYVPDLYIDNAPAYDDDAAAGVGGLTTGMVYQTTGAGAAPLNVAGILMIKQ